MKWQRPSPPRLVSPRPDSDDEKRRRRWLLLILLLLVVLVPLCLWLASQAALIALGLNDVNESLLSRLSAGYERWQPAQFGPLNPALIGTIRADQATYAAGIGAPGGVIVVPFVPGGALPGLTQIAALPTSVPTTAPPPTATQPRPTSTNVIIVVPPATSPVTMPPPTLPPLPTLPPTATDKPVKPPPAVPTVQFSSAAYSVGEGGSVLITVTLNPAASQTVTVNYTTIDGTAQSAVGPGQDYVATSGVLTFTPPQTVQTFSVPTLSDTVYEGPETFQVQLSGPVNAALGSPSTATVTIIDAQSPPTIQFSRATYSVNELDGPLMGMVTLSGPSQLPVTVNVSADFSCGSCTATSSDVTGISGSFIVIPPLQTTATFSVIINNDSLSESNELFQLVLSSPTNATIGSPNPADVIIVEDDGGAACAGNAPAAGEPNVMPPALAGPLFGAALPNWVDIACGSAIVVDLGADALATGHAGYDLVYYEYYTGTGIALDIVQIQVGASATGPWFTVFYWGDGIPDANTNIAALSPPEPDNFVIPSASLYNLSGIEIDIDGLVPPGTYQYVRIYSPIAPGNLDAAQVDALEKLP